MEGAIEKRVGRLEFGQRPYQPRIRFLDAPLFVRHGNLTAVVLCGTHGDHKRSRAPQQPCRHFLIVNVLDTAADAPIGSEYHECYDVAKAVPTQEHLDMFRRVKDEIADMGVEFPF